ncbi:hypothetical protein [Carboxylicivirga sp. M1479]|uniref:hypothetical protein n=1 Tax=Carboxylicivirga sp. M1479 TaxID=2594476 RepID=UPI0011777452|nr:hypothetical protein [Carboxylicivirga sp. M1479]TRX66147.1 hypothetical protein FNN09_15220 [Carboxylicivirga sp. M1479]
MKKLIAYTVFILSSAFLLSCSKDGDMVPVDDSLSYPIGEVSTVSLSISTSGGLKSDANGVFVMNDLLEQEFDPDKVNHLYVTTGYTVKVFDAWVVDENNPDGEYQDIEFEGIDLTDHDIDFQTAGEFEVEVEHPDYDTRKPSFEAYYEFKKEKFTTWPEGEPLIIPMDLPQFAALLVYQSLDVRFTIEKMKIEKEEVLEYQSVYVEKNKDFEVEIKHRNGDRIKTDLQAGDAGECQYFWVESIIFE